MTSETVPDARLPMVELLMPATWNPLDLDPKTRAGNIARLVDRTTKSGSAFADARAIMRAEFESAAAAGVASGAVLAFAYWSAPAGKLASASLFVALVDASGSADRETTLDGGGLAAALAARYGGDVGELAAGPGARVRRRGRVPGSGAGAPEREAEIVQWYVPHESGRRIALLTFSTPNVGLADEFGEVFDALADTLRWTA